MESEPCNVNLTAFNKIHVTLKRLIQTDYPGPPGILYESQDRGKAMILTKEEFEFLGEPSTIDILITPGVKHD